MGGENKDHAMEIENTSFGTITIDGKTYEHDVLIRSNAVAAGRIQQVT